MSFQFIHVEVYARQKPKLRTKDKWSMYDVVNEAERKEGACPHVANPNPPTLVFGEMPSLVAEKAAETASKAVDSKGRRMRADAGCFIAGVASFPFTVEECKNDKQKRNEYIEWEEETIKYLKDEYGDNLKSIIRHTDEPNPHIHFYVLPELTKDNKLNIEDLHDGLRAKAKAKEAGVSKYDQRKYFTEAMKQWQNKYYEKVSIYFGHARIGPGRRRLTRTEWQIERQNNNDLAVSLRNVQEQNNIQSEQARKEADKIKKKAIDEAKRKLRDADRKSASMVDQALQKVAEIEEKGRKLGGWIHSIINGFTGKEKEIERQIKERENRNRKELEEEANKAKNLAALQANSTIILKKEIAILKDQNSDLAKQNEHLRSQIPQDSHEYQRDAGNELKR